MSLTLQIKYQPHNGQVEFHSSPARFRVLACGRRWGKTISGANESIKVATQTPEESVGFCVAPTYWHTQKQWREFLRYCPVEIIRDINRADRRLLLVGNRYVWFKSADNPDSLRSEGLDWLWMDEGGQIKEEAWTLALRPALMDKHGKAWFTGTPKGKNWYFKLWTRGKDTKQTDYESWQFPSQNNPYLDPQEIKDFARDMPDMAYRQEILAEFLEDVGSVFRNVEACIKGSLAAPAQGCRYVVGCDLAKYQDYTVLCVLRDDGQLVAFDRLGELDWVFQRKRIVNLCKQYNARLLLDSTGLGDPVYDELKREQVSVEGYKFTNASKKDLIENLSIMIDNREIGIPGKPAEYNDKGEMTALPVCAVSPMLSELQMFGYTVGSTGLVRYGAPEGYHDDCVIALALAAWQLKRPEAWIAQIDW